MQGQLGVKGIYLPLKMPSVLAGSLIILVVCAPLLANSPSLWPLSVSLLQAAYPSLSGCLLPCSSDQRGALCLFSYLDQRCRDSVFHAGSTP